MVSFSLLKTYLENVHLRIPFCLSFSLSHINLLSVCLSVCLLSIVHLSVYLPSTYHLSVYLSIIHLLMIYMSGKLFVTSMLHSSRFMHHDLFIYSLFTFMKIQVLFPCFFPIRNSAVSFCLYATDCLGLVLRSRT